MFQLLYLRFTQPRADPVGVCRAVVAGASAAREPAGEPGRRVRAGRHSALSRDNPRRQPETPATVDQWDLAKSMAFYKARFADASHFTFVFVGSFTPEMLRPFVETYVASLPATRAGETWRDDRASRRREASWRRRIEKGIAPKSQVAIVFSGPFVYDDAHLLALRTMTMVLQARLFDSDPAAARRHLQHRGRAADAEVPEARIQPAHRLGVRPGAHGEPSCSACSTRSSSSRTTLLHAGAGEAHPRRAAARLRGEQPEQRLPAQPDRAPLRRRRRGARRSGGQRCPARLPR